MRQRYLKWRVENLAKGLGFALLATALAALGRALIGIVAPTAVPFATFLLAVLITTFVAGWLPGILSILLGALAAVYLFFAPRYSLDVVSLDDWASVILFLMVGAMIVAVMQALRSGFDRELVGECRFLRAQEAGGLGDWDWDLRTENVSWSRNLYRLVGQEPYTFTPSSETMKSLLHPDDRVSFAKAIAASLKSGNRFEVEKRVLLPDGSVRHLVSRGEVIRNDAGRAVRITATDIDITQRRVAELALAKSEERYRTLFSAMSEAYVVHELVYDDSGEAVDFRCLEANPAFERSTGIPLDGVVGKLASEFAPGGDPAWLTLFADVARTGRPARLEKFSARAKRWIDLHAFSLGGPRIGAIFLDVTERKQVETAREVAELRLRSAMQIAEIGVYQRDLETDMVTASETCDAIFGFTEHLQSRPLPHYFERIVPEDIPLIQEQIRTAVETRSSYTIEYRVHLPGMPVRWISSKGAVIDDGTGSVRVVGAIFDISTRKHSEMNQQLAREKAENMFREMNHRIKNNLAIVGSLLTMQASRTGHAELTQYLTAARERVQTIADLHESLYQGADLGDVDFAHHTRNICDRIRSSLSTSFPVEWEIQVEPTVLPADIAVPLGLIVNEIATNAVKHAFSEVDDAKERNITVSLTHHSGQFVLAIADNGCGLRGGFSLNSNGLGSKLIHAFVAQVGGTLTVSSDNGTRFEIALPHG